jgi:predicted nucleic acid-binding protein
LGNRLIVIDTDAIIDFFGNISPGAEVVSELISNGEAVLTSITVFELYAGVEGKRRLSQIETLVRDLMVLPLDAIEAATAGKIYTQLKMKGQLIGTNDILIAAVCLANGLPLYTKNVTHFLKIKDIQILTREEILRY